MSDARLDTYLHYGTNAERLAFTPDPPALTGVQPIYVWYETDTGNTYVYYTSWVQISGSSSGLVQAAIVTLTDANIKALPTTDFQLVAAPGAGVRINLISADFYINTTAAVYTNINAASWASLRINSLDVSNYLGDSGAPLGTRLADILNSALITQLTLSPRTVVDYVNGWGVLPAQTQGAGSFLNQPLMLHVDNAAAGNFTGGNAANSLIINTLYTLITP